MIEYLRSHYGNRPSQNANDKAELDFLRKDVKRMKDEAGERESQGSEMGSEESEEDDYIDELP